jgi:hypothetical protein
MNTHEQEWEAALRQKVTEHRFEFDPAAWQAMEQLLDAPPATTATPAAKAAGAWAGWWWATIGWVVVAAGALLYLLRTDDAPPAPTPSSVSAPALAAPEVVAPAVPAQSHTGTRQHTARAPAPQPDTVADAPTLPPPPPPAAAPQEVQTPPASDFGTVSPLPNRPAVLLERTEGVTALPRMAPNTRKRSRRTFFPDVVAYPAPPTDTLEKGNK